MKFLHVLGHVDLDERIAIAEHEFGEGLGQEGFADAGRSKEDERTNRPAGILEIRPRTAQGLANGDDRFVLSDHLAPQFAFHGEEFLRLSLLHAAERHTGPLRDHVHDVVFGDENFALFALFAPFGQDAFELFLGLLFVVAQRGGFLKVLGLDRRFLATANFFDLLFDLLDVRRAGHGANARAGAGFVHHVDGLVRQEPAGQIPVAELGRGHQGLFGEFGLVVRFILQAQSLENEDRFIHARRIDFHLLEAAFERGVLLDVFVQCSLSVVAPTHCISPPTQRGLDDIARVHRAFGRTGSDDGVQTLRR